MKHVLTSYSQFGEDIKLFSALRNEESVFYIDAGANDPQSNSATKLFYDRGGHGINIEPQKFYIAFRGRIAGFGDHFRFI